MVLKCTECGTSFNFKESLLKETGSKVRCSKCKSVFVAYPSSVSDEHPADATLDDDFNFDLSDEDESSAGELDDLDLDNMETLLELDDDELGDDVVFDKSGGPAAVADDDLNLDLDLDSDDDLLGLGGDLDETADAVADDSDLDFDLGADDTLDSPIQDSEVKETMELDIDDMENLLDLDGDSDEDAGVDAASEGSDLDFDLDFSEDGDSDDADLGGGSEDTDEIDISGMEDMFELDEKPDQEDASVLSDDSDFDLDFSEDEPAVADAEEVAEEEASGTMDLVEDDSLVEEVSAMEDLDSTDELDLSDFESMLDDEEPQPAETGSGGDVDELDFTIDDTGSFEDLIDSPEDGTEEFDLSLDSDLSDDGGSVLPEDMEETAELDFSDIDMDEEDSVSQEATELVDVDELESTDELDLSGLEDDSEVDEALIDTDETGDSDLSFDLDLDDDQPDEAPLDATLEDDADNLGDLGDLDDLDISDDDGISDLDFDSPTVDEVDFDDLESATDDSDDSDDSGQVSDLDLSDMDDMLETEDSSMSADDAGADSDDFDMELDFGDDAEEEGTAEFDLDLDSDELVSEEAVTRPGLDDTGDLAMSDLDDMISSSGEDSPIGNVTDSSDLDLVLDFKDGSGESDVVDIDDADDVELEFEVEEGSDLDTDELETLDEPIEEIEVMEEDSFEETFDMGTLGDSEDMVDDDIEEVYDIDNTVPKKQPKKSSGKLVKLLVSAMVVLGLVAGGIYGSEKFGIDVKSEISRLPYVKDIPYVGDFLKPDIKDDGNLYIAILDKTVDGMFVENKNSGTLFVIKGKIKNEYDHSRNFVKVTGTVFTKGAKQKKVMTVYAGNILSDEDLQSLDVAAIEKRMKNRVGNNKINMKIRKGKIIPFMIVFTKYPEDLDEMTIMVKGSMKGRS